MKSLWDLPLASEDSADLPTRRAHTGPSPVRCQRYGLTLVEPLPEPLYLRLTAAARPELQS